MRPTESPPATVPATEAIALVRAIRRAYGSSSGYDGLERFTVTDIHEFARKLVAQGVRAAAADS
jgi:hypothetical protein